MFSYFKIRLRVRFANVNKKEDPYANLYRERMRENHETKHLPQPINVQNTQAPDQSCDQHLRAQPITHPQKHLELLYVCTWFIYLISTFSERHLISAPLYF